MTAAIAQSENDATEWSDRQEAVLDAALNLLVEKGAAVTMTAVARRASCSKETLYKWFGDRNGLLKATVRWQASRVHVPEFDASTLNARSLEDLLVDYAESWLEVISGPRSIALNRIAVAEAVSKTSPLGRIVLDQGRMALGRRMTALMEAGRDRNLLSFTDAEEAFRAFFGLVGRDIQIRLLLGDDLRIDQATRGADARRATNQFLALYGRMDEGRAQPRVRSLD